MWAVEVDNAGRVADGHGLLRALTGGEDGPGNVAAVASSRPRAVLLVRRIGEALEAP